MIVMGKRTGFLILCLILCLTVSAQTKQVHVENLYGYWKEKNKLLISFTISKPDEIERFFVKLGDDIDHGNVKNLIYKVTGNRTGFFIDDGKKKEAMEGNKIKTEITFDNTDLPEYVTVFGQTKEGAFTNKVFYHIKSIQ